MCSNYRFDIYTVEGGSFTVQTSNTALACCSFHYTNTTHSEMLSKHLTDNMFCNMLHMTDLHVCCSINLHELIVKKSKQSRLHQYKSVHQFHALRIVIFAHNRTCQNVHNFWIKKNTNKYNKAHSPKKNFPDGMQTYSNINHVVHTK